MCLFCPKNQIILTGWRFDGGLHLEGYARKWDPPLLRTVYPLWEDVCVCCHYIQQINHTAAQTGCPDLALNAVGQVILWMHLCIIISRRCQAENGRTGGFAKLMEWCLNNNTSDGDYRQTHFPWTGFQKASVQDGRRTRTQRENPWEDAGTGLHAKHGTG